MWLTQPSVVTAAPAISVAGSLVGVDKETDNGNCFEGWTLAGPVAAQWSMVQLFNPNASGKILLLDALWAYDTGLATDTLGIWVHNVQLGAVDTTRRTNKKLGGANPVGQISAQNQAGQSGTEWSKLTGPASASTPSPFRKVFKNPVEIPANFGVHVNIGTQNNPLIAGFEWREV
jgi:hypothetical protein